jgi:hypothetical protein
MTEKPALPGRSWTVQQKQGNRGEWEIIRSHWAPGYTSLHTEHQGEARRAMLDKLQGQLVELQGHIEAVRNLQLRCTSGCDDALPHTVDPECPVHGWA